MHRKQSHCVFQCMSLEANLSDSVTEHNILCVELSSEHLSYRAVGAAFPPVCCIVIHVSSVLQCSCIYCPYHFILMD